MPSPEVSTHPAHGSVRRFHSPSIPSNNPPLADASSPSVPSLPIQTSQWLGVLQLPPLNPIQISALLGQDPALDLSRNLPLSSWAITAEQGPQASGGLPSVASPSETMNGDMSGMQVVMVGSANELHSAVNFARSLTRLSDKENVVSFNAHDVTIQNAEWMSRIAKQDPVKPNPSHFAPRQPTPAGSAIVSLSTSQTRPTSLTTSCAITASDPLL